MHGGTTCMGEGVADLEATVGEANPGFLYGGQPSHRSRAAFGGEPCGCVHPVQQGVEPGASDVGVEVARGRLAAGWRAART